MRTIAWDGSANSVRTLRGSTVRSRSPSSVCTERQWVENRTRWAEAALQIEYKYAWTGSPRRDGISAVPDGRRRMSLALRSSTLPEISCRCDAQKIDAVQAYFTEQFPDAEVHHLHSPSRLQQAGLPPAHTEHHVISVVQEKHFALLCRAAERVTGALG